MVNTIGYFADVLVLVMNDQCDKRLFSCYLLLCVSRIARLSLASPIVSITSEAVRVGQLKFELP